MLFSQYTAETISGHMSLRKPQKESLAILEAVTDAVPLRKGMNLQAALGAVHAMYPICTDFEREFLSLTFALATGVGKTRLMGAFIAYLYTQRNCYRRGKMSEKRRRILSPRRGKVSEQTGYHAASVGVF